MQTDRPDWKPVKIWAILSICVDVVSWIVLAILLSVRVLYNEFGDIDPGFAQKRDVLLRAAPQRIERPAIVSYWWVWLLFYLARLACIIVCC